MCSSLDSSRPKFMGVGSGNPEGDRVLVEAIATMKLENLTRPCSSTVQARSTIWVNKRCREADVSANVQGALVDMTALFFPVIVEEATSPSAMIEPIVSSSSPHGPCTLHCNCNTTGFAHMCMRYLTENMKSSRNASLMNIIHAERIRSPNV